MHEPDGTAMAEDRRRAASRNTAGRSTSRPAPAARWPACRAGDPAGGLVLALMALLVVVSVAGRYLFNAPIIGDYEIVETAGAVAIFLCFPYTHLTGSNIVAEFFTTGLSDRLRDRMDTVHDLIFAAVAALLTWRLALGGMHQYDTNGTTALLAIPVWMAYMVAVAAMALLCVVCIVRFVAGIRRFGR